MTLKEDCEAKVLCLVNKAFHEPIKLGSPGGSFLIDEIVVLEKGNPVGVVLLKPEDIGVQNVKGFLDISNPVFVAHLEKGDVNLDDITLGLNVYVEIKE